MAGGATRSNPMGHLDPGYQNYLQEPNPIDEQLGGGAPPVNDPMVANQEEQKDEEAKDEEAKEAEEPLGYDGGPPYELWMGIQLCGIKDRVGAPWRHVQIMRAHIPCARLLVDIGWWSLTDRRSSMSGPYQGKAVFTDV